MQPENSSTMTYGPETWSMYNTIFGQQTLTYLSSPKSNREANATHLKQTWARLAGKIWKDNEEGYIQHWIDTAQIDRQID